MRPLEFALSILPVSLIQLPHPTQPQITHQQHNQLGRTSSSRRAVRSCSSIAASSSRARAVVALFSRISPYNPYSLTIGASPSAQARDSSKRNRLTCSVIRRCLCSCSEASSSSVCGTQLRAVPHTPTHKPSASLLRAETHGTRISTLCPSAESRAQASITTARESD